MKYDPIKDFVIDLDNVWKWLGFNQKVNAKRVIEKNFNKHTDYKILLCQTEKQDDKCHGGHNKETILLTINTFKKFCLKSGTKKAYEIHDYFIKLENIMFEIVKEDCHELKYKIQKLENTTEQKLIKQKELDNEQFLLREYGNICNIVYIIKVKTNDDGTYIVKIGESRCGITERYNECKYKHKDILLLNCFSVDKCKHFESFLHNHTDIYPTNVNNLFGHENEKENGIPILYKNGVGQYDINNNLIKEFVCKYDCIRELKISDKTLAKSLTYNIPYKNVYFKMLGDKLVM